MSGDLGFITDDVEKLAQLKHEWNLMEKVIEAARELRGSMIDSETIPTREEGAFLDALARYENWKAE